MTSESSSGPPRAVATIGVFDGVHLGHQALVRKVVERAQRLRARSVCVTFSPHPDEVLRPESEIAHLAPLQDRLELIRSLGVSEVALLEFTPSLARMSPEQFMDLLLASFRLEELWVGSDFALGRGRAGSPERLAVIGRERGFQVLQFPPVEVGGQVVSSSRIRRLLAEGRVGDARQLLGRPYRLRGVVVEGDRRGRLLAFPTANLSVGERLCIPGDGVYAGWCQTGRGAGAASLRRNRDEVGLEGGGEAMVGVSDAGHESRGATDTRRWYPAVANVGVRPTFEGKRRQVEIHLIGFEGDLYREELAVDFVACLRGERRFESAAALAAQIREDVRMARGILAGEPSPVEL